MIKKSIFAILCLLATQISNAQSSYFNQDVCMQELLSNGCTEEFETIVINNTSLSGTCPDMRIRLTINANQGLKN